MSSLIPNNMSDSANNQNPTQEEKIQYGRVLSKLTKSMIRKMGSFTSSQESKKDEVNFQLKEKLQIVNQKKDASQIDSFLVFLNQSENK